MVYIAQTEKFISEVGKLYDACKEKRSVWMTFKKFTPQVPKQKSKQQIEKSKAAAAAETSSSSSTAKTATTTTTKPTKKAAKLPEGCLIRVTDGHKKKLSTIVSQKNLATFQITLFNIVKQKMTNLKKAPVTTAATVEPKKTTTATTSSTAASSKKSTSSSKKASKQSKGKSKNV